MAKRTALGRGLGAYFPDLNTNRDAESASVSDDSNKKSQVNPTTDAPSKTPDAKSRVHTVAQIPLSNIKANPYQPRTEFDEDELHELAESIKEHGIIQPLTVRYLGEDRFELISGERRLRASKLAGLSVVPGYIIDADNEQMMAMALIENIQRADLNPIEVALGYQRLIEECNYTQEELGMKVGKKRSTVTNMLRLLHLPAAIQQALIQSHLSAGHARALVAIEETSVQQRVFNKILKEQLSVRQTEELIRKLKEEKPRASVEDLLKKQPKDPFIDTVEEQLREHLSAHVSVQAKKDGGELRIRYGSNDDLQRLLELMGL